MRGNRTTSITDTKDSTRHASTLKCDLCPNCNWSVVPAVWVQAHAQMSWVRWVIGVCQGTACKILRHQHEQERGPGWSKLQQVQENEQRQQKMSVWNPLGPQPPPPPSGPEPLQDWPPAYCPQSRPQPPQQQLITGPPPPPPLKECHEAHQHSQVPPPQPSLQECHEADLHYSQVPRRPTCGQMWCEVYEYGGRPPPPPPSTNRQRHRRRFRGRQRLSRPTWFKSMRLL